MDIILSDIVFPHTVKVTEQIIDISHLTAEQKTTYLNLFSDIVTTYKNSGKDRMVIGLTGPTGSGKSVTAAILMEISKQAHIPIQFATITVDAFHYPNEYLLSHTAQDGKTLKEYKGRPETYDTAKLTKALQDFSDGGELSLPSYSRLAHDPVENTVFISDKKSLLLIEGLWLLYDKNGWREVSKHIPFCYYIETEKDQTRAGTIERHIRGGKTPEEAAAHFDRVDGPNFHLMATTRVHAHKIIRI